jgi:hypothetical protein
MTIADHDLHDSVPMLSAALQYAQSGYAVLPLWWPINEKQCACGNPNCRSVGKHPIGVLVPNGVKDATTDLATVQAWWTRYPQANIGIACGKISGIIVVDLDGEAGEATLARLKETRGARPQDSGWQVITGRGRHLYYKYTEGIDVRTKQLDGLEVRCDDAYVVAPPSLHKSGKRYSWDISTTSRDQSLPPLPDYLIDFARLGAAVFTPDNVITLSKNRRRNRNLTAAAANLATPPPEAPYEVQCVRMALACLPIETVDDRDHWFRLGCALKWTRWQCARELWDDCSKRSTKFDPIDQEKTWNSIEATRDDREVITLGTLFALAKQHRYIPPLAAPIPVDNEEPESVKDKVAELNERYFVIKNLGGKAAIGEFVDSPDGRGKTLSVMSEASFKLAYRNQWVGVVDPEKNVLRKNLASYWVAHPRRRQYESIDFEPDRPQMLPGNKLNVWQGWGVEAKEGNWSKMWEHIWDVIAGGNPTTAQDLLQLMAWKVQHPGERPEIALALQGEKGCGKGIFVHAFASLFNPHSLYISNQDHLTGKFNAHLEGKLIVYSDEAFWAGDKRGESVIKSLITEDIVAIERKGFDVYQAKNRAMIIFAANNDWIIPATGGECRFLVLECSNKYAKGQMADSQRNQYFANLQHEITHGGREAMLYYLRHFILGSWHPRQAHDTEGLRRQKYLSLPPVMQWIERFLQEGHLPGFLSSSHLFVTNETIRNDARDRVPQLRNASDSVLLDTLTKLGCTPARNETHRGRKFPSLEVMRAIWEKIYGPWQWEYVGGDWK